jgi:hypothetical protein
MDAGVICAACELRACKIEAYEIHARRPCKMLAYEK